MQIKVDVAAETGTILAKDIPPGRIAKVNNGLYLIRSSHDSNELIRVWPSTNECESISVSMSIIQTWNVTLMPIGTKLTFES